MRAYPDLWPDATPEIKTELARLYEIEASMDSATSPVRIAELEAALSGLLGIIEDPDTRTIPAVVNAITALKGSGGPASAVLNADHARKG